MNFYTRNGFIKPGDLAFDIGVKVGKITDRLLDAGANVVCVEPMPERARYMKQKYGPKILVLEQAVSDKPGVRALHYSSLDKLNPTLEIDIYLKQFRKPPEVYDEEQLVWVTTLDILIWTHGEPAFIKLDIEGSEYKALKGMKQERVPALSFEFGMGYVEEAYKCIELLGEKGYEFNYTLMHKGDWQLDEWKTANAFEFLVPEKSPGGKYNWGNIYARLKREEYSWLARARNYLQQLPVAT